MPSTMPLQASGLPSHLNPLLMAARLGQAGAAASTAKSASAPAATSSKAATSSDIPPSTKSQTAQAALNKRQLALGTELKSLLANAGFPLTGKLEFSVGANGLVNVSGNEADRSALDAVLKADKTQPQLSTRLTLLAKDAQVLAATTAVFSVSPSGSSLSCAGMPQSTT